MDASTAPIALQLKAIDEEYHNLVNSGQSGKADHVMKLFAWKSKQASQVNKIKCAVKILLKARWTSILTFLTMLY